MNRLGREKSPYLLQHAHNPVDWYPWGDEAFLKAKDENKPLILSIGYSTCHWCHVMERECFENEAIAKIMNEGFVCMKLDREERPDVDKIYMTAVQAMTGQGGWPLNVFLTPEGEPFYGGTYFPPEPRWGQPSWPALLGRIAELWRDKRAELRGDAARLTQLLREEPRTERAAPRPDGVYAALKRSYDSEHKGFGHAPKFPMPVNLYYLLRHHARTGAGLDLVVDTLKAMAAGGIFDQVGGGFHRYSVDEAWRVPHFEKMLYDNAQLASVAWEAYQATSDPALERICRRTLNYLKRDLRHPEGGFYSAEDADSEGHEGTFYLWDEAPSERYGLHDFEGRGILYDKRPDEPVDEALLEKLRRRRDQRPRPHLDDKILASWNGLAISAFAKAGEVDTAAQAARFLKKNLYVDGRLWRRWRDGERAVPGISDDYAFVAQGLLDLFEATGAAEWLDWARELTATQQRLFAAPGGGLYMTSADHDARLLTRVIEDSDNVEPCASSVAAGNLLRLWRLSAGEDFRKAAAETIERFGAALPYLAGVIETELMPPQELVIVGAGEPKGFNPARVVIRANELLRSRMPWLPKEPGLYICENRTCRRTESA
jgi:uncharacterized protein